jgi:hypothetical protein
MQDRHPLVLGVHCTTGRTDAAGREGSNAELSFTLHRRLRIKKYDRPTLSNVPTGGYTFIGTARPRHPSAKESVPVKSKFGSNIPEGVRPCVPKKYRKSDGKCREASIPAEVGWRVGFGASVDPVRVLARAAG